MATQCPRCHQMVEEDYVCCADVEIQWICTSCHKRTRGFAIPFGRCPLCHGKLERAEIEEHPSKQDLIALQEAIQIEVNGYHFYRHLAEAVDDPDVGEFFNSLSEMEKEHAEELSQKYHIDLGPNVFVETEKRMSEPFFEALGFFPSSVSVEHLYECAIKLEKRAHDFFLRRAESMPEGREKNLYLELAAEEEEHIALLETQRDR